MRHRILLATLAFGALCGSMTACSSPPVATTHETVATPKVQEDFTNTVASNPVAFAYVETGMHYSLTAPAILEPVSTVIAVTAASDCTSDKNCSKPHRVGLAIRQRVKRSVDAIHLLVLASSGYRLLHCDPGLC